MTDTREKIRLTIYDDELHERFGDKALLIIDALDRDMATQKGLGTYPHDARVRISVEKFLRAKGHLGAGETL